jgi:hypothetical protein
MHTWKELHHEIAKDCQKTKQNKKKYILFHSRISQLPLTLQPVPVSAKLHSSSQHGVSDGSQSSVPSTNPSPHC